MATTLVVVSLVSIVAAIVASAAGSGSNSDAWFMINQYQLMLSVPLLETELPPKLLYFLEGFEFSTFQFNFLEDWSFGEVDNRVSRFDYPQPREGLKIIGYESGSSIVNEYNFAKAMFTICCTNLCIMLFYYIFKSLRRYKWFRKLFKRFSKFFVLTVYVRTIIEAYFFVLLSSMSEIVSSQDTVKNGWSYTFAYFLVIF